MPPLPERDALQSCYPQGTGDTLNWGHSYGTPLRECPGYYPSLQLCKPDPVSSSLDLRCGPVGEMSLMNLQPCMPDPILQWLS